MGNGQSSRKISAQDRAILDLKNQRDRLHQYQRRLTHITTLETKAARECLARGDKPRALLALRRKKYQESLLLKTDAQLEQLEILTGSVEFALVQKDVLFGLKTGTEVLKDIHKEIGGIEEVEKLMGEGEREREFQKEVSDLLASQMTNQEEDEVEDELEALEREVNGPVAVLPDAPKHGVIEEPLPDAPTTEMDENEEEEEEEAAAAAIRKRQKERAKARAKDREQENGGRVAVEA